MIWIYGDILTRLAGRGITTFIFLFKLIALVLCARELVVFDDSRRHSSDGWINH